MGKIAEWWDKNVLGETDAEGKKPAPVNLANEIIASYGVHNIMKYDIYDKQTGLFYNENSIAFCFEVLPQTGADDEMVQRLTTIFTPVPPDHGIQWFNFGNTIVDPVYARYLELRREAIEKGLNQGFGLELAKRRVDYVQRKKGKPMFDNSLYIIKRPTLLFSVTRTGNHDDKKLIREMTELAQTLKSALNAGGLPSVQVDAEDLINILWPLFNPEEMFNPEPFERISYDDGKSIKQQLTKFGHHALVHPKHVVFGMEPDNENEEDHRVAVRSFGVQRYPQYKQLFEMGDIIGAMFDDGLQYPCPYLITCGIYTLDSTNAETTAQIRSARANQNAESKMAKFQPELPHVARDWNAVVQHINNGGTMCELYHTVTLFSPIKQIDRYSQILLNIWRNERFTIGRLDTVQLAALYSAMPMILTTDARNDLKKLRLITTKTTINAIDMSPILAEWQGIGDPVVMLFGRRGTPVFIDFFANQQGNYNLFVSGVSGAGKSVVLQEFISAYKGIGAQAFIIDVGRSFKNFVSLENGSTFDFRLDSDICMNPFSWIDVADKETDVKNSFNQELKLLRPMYAKMAAPSSSLTDYQYVLLTEALTDVWENYGNKGGVDQVAAFLSTIKDQNGEAERVAFELAKQLQPFTSRGMFGGYFNGEANISFDNDLIYLELEELSSVPELRAVVLFAITSRIMAEMYLKRDRKKFCLIDEAWQLLGNDAETASFIEEGYRRARKYNGIFALGTQGIDDAFKNTASQAAYSNADWKIHLRQDLDKFAALEKSGQVNFSAATLRQIKSLKTNKGRYSEMLVMSPMGNGIVRHLADPFSLIMASTNAADYTECENLLSQGYSTAQTIDIMLERRGHHK